MSDELPEVEWPQHSLLKERRPGEWAAYGLGTASVSFTAGARIASPRATTSSRTPGKVNRGTVYARTFEHDQRDWHVCGCGCKQTLCLGCLVWICDAPGHIKHVCPERR